MKLEVAFLVIWAVGMIVTWPLIIWRSVKSRRLRGEPLVPRPPVDAVYAERSASGSQEGKWGGASNCLMVVVANNELWLSPTFPFTLFIPYGFFGLECRRRLREVSAEPRKSWRGTNVRLVLRGVEEPRLIHLRVRVPSKFLGALEA